MSVGLTQGFLVATLFAMRGRPTKPEGDARTNILRIRLKPAERALLDHAAEVRSLETSSWGRSELLALARKIVGRRK